MTIAFSSLVVRSVDRHASDDRWGPLFFVVVGVVVVVIESIIMIRRRLVRSFVRSFLSSVRSDEKKRLGQ